MATTAEQQQQQEQPPSTTTLRHRPRAPIPPPVPAYLPVPGATSSPLLVDRALYASIRLAPRVLLDSFTLPVRSGRAWRAPAGSIVRISTPEGPQVGDLNIWSAANPRERFWASRTQQLHASHVTTGDRLWSTLPWMRPLCTVVADTLGGDGGGEGEGMEGQGEEGVRGKYGVDEHGGRCHDLLGTRCDPYINSLLSSSAGGEDGAGAYDYHCHSNLVRAVLPWGLNESDVHDVINLFQVTGLDDKGRYFMNPCPAEKGDYIEFLAEQDLLMALSTCPGGDLSLWGFGSDSEKEMIKCCRPLKVEVFAQEDGGAMMASKGWKPATVAPYKGMHGMTIPTGEGL